MKPKAKSFLSNFFIGLFSNKKAIEGSKTNPWWVALIIGLASALLPVIPIAVSQARSYGASFISGNVYKFDDNLANTVKDLYDEGVEFKVNGDHLLEYYVNDKLTGRDLASDTEPIAEYINTFTHQYELRVYYTERSAQDMRGAMVDAINAKSYIVGSTNAYESGDSQIYAPSYIILGKEGIYTRINKTNTTELSSQTGFASDWKHFEIGKNLIRDSLPENVDEFNPNNYEQRDKLFNNWKEYYNDSYLNQRTYNTWVTSSIFLSIFIGLIFFMGLLVFLLTRGKSNMFNYLKFMDCEKIVWWAALSPAILALAFGFIFTQFAQMIFIILLGLRVMWISMKQLRPQY